MGRFFAAAVYFVLYVIAVILFCGVGALGDWLHVRKVRRGDARYRLPFYLRWKGWTIGPLRSGNPDEYKFGMHYDKVHNRIIPIFRTA